MMDFNQNWERWCKISIIKHFEKGISPEQGNAEGSYFFVEGFARDTEGRSDWVEFRLDGPYIKQPVRNQFRLYFELNLLVVVQEGNEDAFRINKLTGLVSSLFLDCVEVKRYGVGPEDDDTLLGCLCLVPRPSNERIQVSHFGKINPSVGIYQASVEGHYQILLD